jgi:hypothetical protein
MLAHQEYSIPFTDASMTVWLGYLIAALVYCSPMMIAFVRNVEYKWPLYFGNLLLGFTGIGWVYCLFYAVFGDKEKAGKISAVAVAAHAAPVARLAVR